MVTLPDLSHLDEEYQTTEAASGGSELPDGKYQVRIDRATMKPYKDPDAGAFIHLELMVLAGPCSGMRAAYFLRINSDGSNLKWVKKDLLTLQYKGQLSQIEHNLEQFLDVCLEISVSTKKDREGTLRTNTYLNKRIDPQSVPTRGAYPDADFSPPPPEGDIPF